jgi:hypothetical protein
VSSFHRHSRRGIGCALLIAAALCLIGAGSGEEGDPSEDKGAGTTDDESPDGGVADGGAPPEGENEVVEPEALPVPLAVTVSGGVSLGAYQAGFLYYLSETIKQNPDLLEFEILTGASAGLINSLLALISVGGDPDPDPTDTEFYKTWTELRWNELFDVDEAPVFALSSRKVMHRLGEAIRVSWKEGIDPSVDIVMGATATRMRSIQTELSKGLTVSRQEEKFVFRVRGQGPGREPLITNYADPSHVLSQPVLPFHDPDLEGPADGRDNFDILMDILFASSSLPLIFESQEIAFCNTEPGGVSEDRIEDQLRCEEPDHIGEFADGALLDKWPLRLAYRTSRAGLIRDQEGRLSWRDVPDLDRSEPPDDQLFFLYIDPDDAAYPPLPPPTVEGRGGEPEEVGLFKQLGLFFGGYLVSTQAKELYTLVEEHPDVREQMNLASRDLPSASGLLANFFGFFDREFRRYDFFLGMRDARMFVQDVLGDRIRRVAGESVELVLPEPTDANDHAEAWRPYRCLSWYLDGDERFAGSCSGDDLQDFRILLQVSLDRLYDHCRRLPADEPIQHGRCAEARAGAIPPEVPGVQGDLGEDDWMSEEGESEFGYVMRLLESYEFHFEDFGLKRSEARRAMSLIREELLNLVDAFGKKLPWGERQSVRVLGKPAVNFFKYAPPRMIIYFVAGKGAEIGTSITGTWIPSRWFRLNAAVQMQGLVQLASEAPNVFTLTPLIGFELEIPGLNGPMIQARGGLRTGYQLTTEDRFHSRTCDYEWFSGDSVRCSAPVFQGFIAVSFYERIRVQLGLEWFPEFLPPMDEAGTNVWNGLIEVGWQWISPF